MRIDAVPPSIYRYGLMRDVETFEMFASLVSTMSRELVTTINHIERPDNPVVTIVDMNCLVFLDGSCNFPGLDGPVEEYYDGPNTLVTTNTSTWVWRNMWIKLPVILDLSAPCRMWPIRGYTMDGNCVRISEDFTQVVAGNPVTYHQLRFYSMVSISLDTKSLIVSGFPFSIGEEMKLFSVDAYSGAHLVVTAQGAPIVVERKRHYYLPWDGPEIVDGWLNVALCQNGDLYQFQNHQLVFVRSGVYVPAATKKKPVFFECNWA
jgi:hypothetical protein